MIATKLPLKMSSILRRNRPLQFFAVGVAVLVSLQGVVSASPFGAGVFGEDVPFGSLTSISIATDGNVSMTASPSGSVFNGQGSHTITVTSTDVVGYELYIKSPLDTDMTNGPDVIPTSGNGSPAALAMNTWGYNTDGSSNYSGVLTTDTLIKDVSGPYKNGDDTTVTYGVKANTTKRSGTYTVGVTYTAVAKSG